MDKRNQQIWDVAVIGGGPAGMMAAGRAAEHGVKVILIEKNSSLGKKLLITGGRRCNLTNAEFNARKFLDKFKESGKFLFSAFSRWSVKETIDFFRSRKMEIKIEAENRVFPKSESAKSVLDVLVNYMKEGGVVILSGSSVSSLIKKENFIEAAKLKDGREIKARAFILATGGKSRPETGSTGDGLAWLESIGHTVIKPNLALTPITVKEQWIKLLQGVSLPDVKITLIQNNKKQATQRGKIIFTHFGLSGPAILNISKEIGKLLENGEAIIALDLFPLLDYEKIDQNLREIFKTNSNKKFKNCFGGFLPYKLAPIAAELSGISPDVFCHSITREERLKLAKLLKDMRMEAIGLLGADEAIITGGGIALEEVDFKTMRSRVFSNLYFAGDILNIDRPSGGYSLQLCWTTGYVAGDSAGIAAKK